MTKIEKIPHPMIEKWAKQHFDLEYRITRQIGALTDEEAQSLKLAAASLTDRNCWFAEFDVKPLVEHGLRIRERSAKKKLSPDAAGDDK